MKNLAEELEFEKMNVEVKKSPLILLDNKEITKESKYVLKNLRDYSYIGVKRISDIIIGFLGTLVVIPIMAFVKIAYLKHGDKAPILFKQKRIGKNGKDIEIYKIRSMVVDADKILEEMLRLDENLRAEYKETKKLKNDPRITKVGGLLRKTSLDEFPQFINVLKGDMSIVGPRPYLPREKGDMEKYYNDIIECKPGITGLWQVSGRSEINFANRCRLDGFYNKHKGFIFDIKIFIKTFLTVLTKKGAV